jgi:hypothetical protein
MDKRVRVMGGYRDESGKFRIQRDEVVWNSQLATLFRRDDFFRGCPVIRFKDL